MHPHLATANAGLAPICGSRGSPRRGRRAGPGAARSGARAAGPDAILVSAEAAGEGGTRRLLGARPRAGRPRAQTSGLGAWRRGSGRTLDFGGGG